MALVNQVQISGYVATEPKAFGKDLSVGRMRMRWDRRKKAGDKWESEGNFFTVVVFGTDVVSRFLELKQGDKVLIAGRLSQNEFEKDGQKRDSVEVHATEFAYIPTDTQINAKQDDSPKSEAADFLDVS